MNQVLKFCSQNCQEFSKLTRKLTIGAWVYMGPLWIILGSIPKYDFCLYENFVEFSKVLCSFNIILQHFYSYCNNIK